MALGRKLKKLILRDFWKSLVMKLSVAVTHTFFGKWDYNWRKLISTYFLNICSAGKTELASGRKLKKLILRFWDALQSLVSSRYCRSRSFFREVGRKLKKLISRDFWKSVLSCRIGRKTEISYFLKIFNVESTHTIGY